MYKSVGDTENSRIPFNLHEQVLFSSLDKLALVEIIQAVIVRGEWTIYRTLGQG